MRQRRGGRPVAGQALRLRAEQDVLDCGRRGGVVLKVDARIVIPDPNDLDQRPGLGQTVEQFAELGLGLDRIRPRGDGGFALQENRHSGDRRLVEDGETPGLMQAVIGRPHGQGQQAFDGRPVDRGTGECLHGAAADDDTFDDSEVALWHGPQARLTVLVATPVRRPVLTGPVQSTYWTGPVASDMPRPTLARIATLAGVSKSTAAYILNGGPAHITFSPSTRERVEAVARELGYRPNLAARATSTGRTGGIALLHADGPLPDELLWAIHDRAAQHGLALTLARLPDPQLADPAHVPPILATYAVDGVLVVGVRPPPDAVAAAIQRLNIPAIRVGCPAAHDAVATDEEAAGRELAEHLLRLGHRRQAFVAIDPADPVEARRAAGWSAALGTAGVRPRIIDVSALSEALARDDRPSALVLADAAGHVGAVPEDVVLAGFASRPLLLGGKIVATHVQPLVALGRAGVDQLRARIAAPETRLPGLLVAGQLIG